MKKQKWIRNDKDSCTSNGSWMAYDKAEWGKAIGNGNKRRTSENL